jgi:uncharacterized protein
MFSRTWRTSVRKYGVVAERDVKIAMSDGTIIDADVFRPASDDKFPALLGYHPYAKAPQTAVIYPGPISMPAFLLPGQEKATGYLEAGDPNFFVRRGYVMVVANIRGTGKSTGRFDSQGPKEVQDGVEIIDWISRQPWCDGNVGMYGVSYFSVVQPMIAAKHPPALKCLWAPWGWTDAYRDSAYHGGMLAYGFRLAWSRNSIDKVRTEIVARNELGEDGFKKAISALLVDEDISQNQALVQALREPDVAGNGVVVDQLLHPLDGPFWAERRVDYEAVKVPAYLGADWGNYGMHLPGAFRNWEKMNVPKKLIIGPQAYLDRPLYQLADEAIRWFDYWLKGIDTGIMEEPPVRLFVMGSGGKWKESALWPLPETKWNEFFLHQGGLLSEHELWPNEGYDSYDDSPWHRGYLEYTSPPMVEETELIGPIVLNLFASSTDKEAHFFVSLREVDPHDNERVLTRGWLKASHRAVDPERSKPWEPFHPHDRPEPLVSNEIYEFKIGVVPTANLFKPGFRVKLKISGCDDAPKNPLEAIASGHMSRQSPSRITVYHDEDHPSSLLLPVTRGNIIGTFMTGGKPFI